MDKKTAKKLLKDFLLGRGYDKVQAKDVADYVASNILEFYEGLPPPPKPFIMPAVSKSPPALLNILRL